MARSVRIDGSWESWRDAARGLAGAHVAPADVVFRDPYATADLFAADAPAPPLPAAGVLRVPKAFLDSARFVAHHRSDERWGLLYRVLYRLTHGEPELLADIVDPDIHRVYVMTKEVRRDEHKMHAFVRFRRVGGESEQDAHYIAWHRPDHLIVPLVAPFFVERFMAMHWTILTPDRSVSWDGNAVTFSEGVPRSAAPQGDELEELWRTYYANIFNPARLKISAMRGEMPKKHWATLPEAALIPTLIHEASERATTMVKKSASKGTAAPFVPDSTDLDVLRAAAKTCEGCPLYKNATQTVFGEGLPSARVVMVGEQPGDEEDKVGRPFVGPAGKVFDKALAAAGISRSDVYVTNAVKHFKWRPHGKRRLHQKPDGGEIEACKPWLSVELARVKPEVIVALGATAAQSVLGKKVTIGNLRGQRIGTSLGDVVVSYHPSAILRAPDDRAREEMFNELVEDLRLVRKVLAA